ncbi:hypothetical protein POVCU1_055880 [Plasmodium ovale curtisi]|uniref:PIR Superfamily Protein n=1 Tax=Plasmodium ovale curtisi TaxID=864141 RepID=A0A1A8X6Q1_PLAOA|nr:hypothetical protein POVCU1_055880 [Plasmodium ovale curtisi]
MKINVNKFKQFPERYKKFMDKTLNGNSNILCADENDTVIETINDLTKCNHNSVHDDMQSKSFLLPLKTCYLKGISKFSLIIILYQVLILQIALASTGTQLPNSSGLQTSPPASSASKWPSDKNFFDSPVEWLIDLFTCVLTGQSQCMQLTFLIIFLVGGFLSALGAAYKYLCKCCTCCGSKKKEQVDYREQFEQMQQEQEELRKALMDGHYFDKDKMGLGDKKDKDDKDGKDDKKDRDDKHHKYNDNDKDDKCNEKNNDASNGKSEPLMKRSQSQNFHIGYQNAQH